jgi:hypothetical protein
MRDGYAPPTMNLHNQESDGHIDCLAEYGVTMQIDRSLKLSQAFGGHLGAVALNRPQDANLARAPQPLISGVRVRSAQPVYSRAV